MTVLNLALLGEPRLAGPDGAEITVPSRKSMALLAYLAANRGRSASRERIMGLLWGDRFDQQARQSLRQTLYSLRKLLGPEGEQALAVAGDTVSLNPSSVRTDLAEFERLAISNEAEALTEAVRLYRGPLLAGFAIRDAAFMEWLEGERTRLQDLAGAALYRIAKHHKAAGSYDEALAMARRLLDLNPLREKAHRLIMRIQAKSGDRAQALLQYQRCAEVLHRELGVEPDFITIRTYEEIKASGEAAEEDGEDDLAVAAAPSGGTATAATATAGSAAPASRLRPQGSFFAPDRPAVVVLPFTILGGGDEQQYFAQGITLDITSGLACWRWFPVIGASSSRSLADAGSDPMEVARQVEARYAVTGTVRRSGEGVRISASLIDAPTGHNLWSGRYDATLDDLFAVQDEITEKIVSSIEPEVQRAEHERSIRKPTEDMTAWDRVMRANWLRWEMTSTANNEAIRLLEEAIRIDPHLSTAWSGLAHSHWLDGVLGWTKDPARSFLEAERCARMGLSLDESDWIAHTQLGLCDIWNRRDYDSAMMRLERAVALNPSSSIAHHSAACVLEFSGLPEKGLAHLRTVLRLDPRYANNASLLGDMALSYLQLRQFEDAITYARKAVSIRPDYARVYHRLAAALAHLGHEAEARDTLDKAFALEPGFSEQIVLTTYPFRNPEHLDILLSGLRKAGLRAEQAA
jgi:DNA-binding SARP family transcriptional activator/TolB-like protein/Tfp pilus assembly protein PilF